MSKRVFVTFGTLALLLLAQHSALAFKLSSFSVQKGSAPASTAAAAPAPPPFNPNALLMGVTNAVTGKLNTVNSLVGQIVMLKQSVAQGLLRAVGGKVAQVQSALAPVISSASSAIGAKLNTVQGAVGGIVSSASGVLGGKVNTLRNLAASKPILIRKTISVGIPSKPGSASTPTAETTTSASAATTYIPQITTVQSAGYKYGR